MNMEKSPVRTGSQQENWFSVFSDTRWISLLNGEDGFMGAFIPDSQKKATVYVPVKSSFVLKTRITLL
jgi:hypothetical protein